ncbi:unnamed protein product [Clavelina lepadiformis]|uniref:Thioredoxin n=1 Tax=Clavelina lepadiformis TaxID=159417 RepID=A0ABP0FA69_CLALP
MSLVIVVKTQDEFDEKVNNNKLVVVDFFATWCGPCKMISPKLETLASKYKDEVLFLKVDVDEAEEVAARCGIQSMPTFHFYKDGQKHSEFSGANINKVEETIQKMKT